jgi:bidirectional [NiFe] hydrogenase diaphorase subunit
MRDQAIHSGSVTDGQSAGKGRFTLLDAAMKRHRHQPDALIEVLHTAQEVFGHLDRDMLLHVARGLKLPPSRVYGVATFYHFFSFAPKGAHTCVVCLGTACYVKGGDSLVAELEQELGVHPGQTTPDGRVSFETARCIGACGLAPVVIFDGAVRGKQTADQVRSQLAVWSAHEPAR